MTELYQTALCCIVPFFALLFAALICTAAGNAVNANKEQ